MNLDKVIIGPLLTEKGSVLTENLNKLNKIYVGMYDAMHK